MRVVVTGNQGQVVTALTMLPPGDDFTIIPLGRPLLDLENPAGIGEALARARPDVVISAAAYTHVDAAEADVARAHAVNAVAPGRLAKAAAELGAPIIHLSTDYVFDGLKPTPYVETDPPAPGTVYGRTKLEGEQEVAANNLDHVILRTSWLYAPLGHNFVRTMLALSETRDRVKVVADQVGNPTYVCEVAPRLLDIARALRERRVEAGVYHLTADGEASWAEFAEAIFDGSRRRGRQSAFVDPISSADYPTAAKRPANSRLDCTKISTALGIRLPPWRLGLESCLDILSSPVE